MGFISGLIINEYLQKQLADFSRNEIMAKIFVQENFHKCKSIDQNIESRSACFSVV